MAFRGLALAAALIMVGARPAPGADDAAKVAAARRVVVEWAAIMDGGRYEDCWNGLSETVTAKIPKAQFIAYMTAVRKPLGAVKDRQPDKTQYVPSLQNQPELEGAIITFQTSFESRSGVLETFGVIHDKDGQWRVGYYLTN